MSDDALAEALLAAEDEERAQLVRGAEPEALTTAVQALGHRRDPAAAEVLALVDEVVEDRALRKAARRELHRLRSMGVEPPRRPEVLRGEATGGSSSSPLAITEAWATDIDPTGTRAIWLFGERALGGIWFAAVLLNDQHGLQDLSLLDTTRKRFQRDFEAARREAGTWASLPGEYTLRLMRESVDLTREVGGGLPTRYHAFKDIFGEAPGPPERALIYEAVSLVEINFNPGWLEDSPQLLGEPEVAGWYVPAPPEFRARALEVARAPMARLLMPGHTPEQQVLQLLADVARQAVTPLAQRGLRRRLEETGYLLLETDRLKLARLAAAAARALDVGGVAPDRHPLVRLLLAAGLARLVGSEPVLGRRASEALLELVQRATLSEVEAGPVETRPSGLILPR